MTGLLALAICALPPQPAEPTVAAVAVALSPAESAAVPALQAQATQALFDHMRPSASPRPKLRAVDAAERLDAAGAASLAAAERDGAATMKEGRAAFDNLDLPGAIRLFGQAASLLAPGAARGVREEAKGRSIGIDAYVQAIVWQAASRWVDGDHDGAHEGLAQAFAIEPGAALDRDAFPPDFVEEAGRARSELVAQPPAAIEVQVEPPALVWIDGVPRGAAPVRVALPPGAHLVAATAPGESVATSLSSGPTVTLKLSPSAEGPSLDAARHALAEGFESHRRAAALAALRERLGVDQLVAVALEGEGASLRVAAIRVAADGHVLGFSHHDVLPGGSEGDARTRVVVEDAATAALKDVLAQDLPRGPGGRPVTDTGLSGGGLSLHLGRPQLAVLAAGVGAAALVAGTLFGVAELHDRSAYAATAQTDTGRSAFLRGLGARNGTISDVLDVVGLAGLGAAAAVWYWPRGPAAPSARTEVLGAAAVPLPGGGAAALAGRF